MLNFPRTTKASPRGEVAAAAAGGVKCRSLEDLAPSSVSLTALYSPPGQCEPPQGGLKGLSPYILIEISLKGYITA